MFTFDGLRPFKRRCFFQLHAIQVMSLHAEFLPQFHLLGDMICKYSFLVSFLCNVCFTFRVQLFSIFFIISTKLNINFVQFIYSRRIQSVTHTTHEGQLINRSYKIINNLKVYVSEIRYLGRTKILKRF